MQYQISPNHDKEGKNINTATIGQKLTALNAISARPDRISLFGGRVLINSDQVQAECDTEKVNEKDSIEHLLHHCTEYCW